MFSKYRTKQATPEVEEQAVVEPAPKPVEETVQEASSRSSGSSGGLSSALQMSGMKPSVISEGFVITGDISAPGTLHIEGTVKGQLKVIGATIGPRGVVEGTLECGSLQVKGLFAGTATCRDLFVASSATVTGRIYYQELTVQRGASIQGDLIIRDGTPPAV